MLLYDFRFQDFQGKFHARWLGPYEIEVICDNGAVNLRTIDFNNMALVVNSH